MLAGLLYCPGNDFPGVYVFAVFVQRVLRHADSNARPRGTVFVLSCQLPPLLEKGVNHCGLIPCGDSPDLPLVAHGSLLSLSRLVARRHCIGAFDA